MERNYTIKQHLGRLLWLLVWCTVWKLLWHRIYVLRTTLLKVFGTRVESTVNIFSNSWVEIPWNLELERCTTIGPRVHIYNLGMVKIGKGTVISQDAYLCGGTHDYHVPGLPLVKSEIEIERDVWICAGAFIGPGVKICEGAIVAARAVVVKDVDAWTIVAGNPARPIGMRKDRMAIAVP